MPEMDAVRVALDRVDEDLALLDSVTVANTNAARGAMVETRLSVLERFHREVAAALGGETTS